jgi:hypothetical protein
MAWLEIHQEIARHPKTKRLARMLDVSVPTAIGHLLLFWLWALDYAQDGALGKFTAFDLADAACFDGDAQVLVQARLEANFIDSDEQNALYIHDWYDYAGRLIDKRKQNKTRMKNARATHVQEQNKSVQRTCNARAGSTVQNSTVHNSTKPKEKERCAQAHTPAHETTPDTTALASNRVNDAQNEQAKGHKAADHDTTATERQIVGKQEAEAKRFCAPSVAEVRAYCAEKGFADFAEHFCDYYSASGWCVGKKPMKNWQAAVRNWQRNEAKFGVSVNTDMPSAGKQNDGGENRGYDTAGFRSALSDCDFEPVEGVDYFPDG